ncbi:hypothetical protein HELRODRAFT_193378 [Helobdella robusta]|uniref:Bromo domain-containing protein n=1 Tax=Helobdella robusta TaxID=6412 RepID=T1FUX7_HELRO|nr:hypothetical protein HELRODRAFT_193378 [Helobdella robusta]ESN96827.1 hypothetical protein HELRODRAFT_193378 [Helobdella robusta]
MSSEFTNKRFKRGQADVWSTREKLSLASAVMRSGDQNWVSVSRSIRPFLEPGRCSDWFSQINCARQYEELLDKVETPKRKRGEKDVERPGDVIVKKLTAERIEELKVLIQQQAEKYRTLKNELEKIKSGQLQDQIKEIWSKLSQEKTNKQLPVEEDSVFPPYLELSEMSWLRQGLLFLYPGLLCFDKFADAMEEDFDAEDERDISKADFEENNDSNLTSDEKILGKNEIVDESYLNITDNHFVTIENNDSEDILISTEEIIEDVEVDVHVCKNEVTDNLGSQNNNDNPPNDVEDGGDDIKAAEKINENDKTDDDNDNMKCNATTDYTQDNCTDTKNVISSDVDMKDDVDINNLKTTNSNEIEKEIVECNDFSNEIEVAERSLMEAVENVSSADDENSVKYGKQSYSDEIDTKTNADDDKSENNNLKCSVSNIKEESAELKEINASTTPDETKLLTSLKLADSEGDEGCTEPSSPSSSISNSGDAALSSKHTNSNLSAKSLKKERKYECNTKKALTDKEDLATVTTATTATTFPAIKEDLEYIKESEVSSSKADTTDDEEEDDDDIKNDHSLKLSAASATLKPKFAELNESLPNSPASFCNSDTEDERTHKVWKKSIMLVWRGISNHKFANIFMHPVTEDIAPGYHTTIFKPMDLNTIRKNIDIGVIRTTSEFQRDMMLMFTNAIMYNHSSHDVHKMALEMYKDSMAQIEQFVSTQMMVSTEPKLLRTLRRSDVAASDKEDETKKKRTADEANTPSITKKRK